MGIVWDREKEERLRRERGIELREVAELIEEGRCRDVLLKTVFPSRRFHRQYGAQP